MRSTTALLLGLCLLATLPLAACKPAPDRAAPSAPGIASQVKDEVRQGLDEGLAEARREIADARDRLASEDISLNRGDRKNLPKAKITPAGQLVIDGKAVATTPEQQALVLAYRAELLQVIGDGMAIGMAGTQIGIDAAAAALKGVFSGKSGDEVGKEAEAIAEQKIKPMVEQLCGRLPGLLAAQQALAEQVPEFRPYASTEASDVDDCKDGGTWSF